MAAGEARDESWYVETKKKIREAFQLFDKDRKGCVADRAGADAFETRCVCAPCGAGVVPTLPAKFWRRSVGGSRRGRSRLRRGAGG